ncbi:metallophosphoesterase [Thermaerobacter litoralis]
MRGRRRGHPHPSWAARGRPPAPAGGGGARVAAGPRAGRFLPPLGPAPRPTGLALAVGLGAAGWSPGSLAAFLQLVAALLILALAWGYLVEPRWLKARAYRLRLDRPAGGQPVSIPLPAPAPGAAGAAPNPAPRAGEEPGTRPARLRLVHLTDLHAPVYRIAEGRLIRWIEAWQPDAVVFTGDLAEGKGLPAGRGVALLRRLARRWPVYLVPGNHDHLYGWYGLRRDLEAAGVQVLVNRGVQVGSGAAAIFLAGVDDPHTGRHDLGAALAGAPPGLPVVLLAHAPADGIRQEAARRGVALALAGHTHGGQVRLPLVGALWIPGQGWFPTYDRGWFPVAGTWWYINTGLGTPRPWIRLLCRPEVVLLELVLP